MFVKATRLGLAATAIVAVAAGSAMAVGLTPGQFSVGGIQQICVKRDGTWYGTTFTFNGHWKNVANNGDIAALWGNYQSGGAYYGYYNDTITVKKGPVIDWYDYNDDNSYSVFLGADSWSKVKTRCDPPAAKANVHPAATQ
jgi:hypothetical protein